jgi:hypothetical protein
MVALQEFFRRISNLGIKKRGNDKIKISDSAGQLVNLIGHDYFCFNSDVKNKAINFLQILAALTSWSYKDQNWQWTDFKLKKFNKSVIRPNNKNFESLIHNKPLSWAMTSSLAIEYTLDNQNIFLE